jgi:cysteine synthase
MATHAEPSGILSLTFSIAASTPPDEPPARMASRATSLRQPAMHSRSSEPDPETGEFLQARLNRVREVLGRVKNGFWPDQYVNRKNPDSHYLTTMREVATALGNRLDFLFVATSTCGTVRGCGEYIRDYGLGTRLIAVDAVGSLIFSDVRAKRLIPGLGAGLRPPLCDLSVTPEYINVGTRSISAP